MTIFIITNEYPEVRFVLQASSPATVAVLHSQREECLVHFCFVFPVFF
jgi:hypothetical protein